MNQNSSNQFHCPFQIKGDKDGTILDITLNDSRETRIQLITEAYKYFHENILKATAIRFNLPDSVKQKCSSNEQLKIEIIEYQAEILACELDYRLSPFLPYQMLTRKKEELLVLYEQTPYKFATVNFLTTTMKQLERPLRNVFDLADWIELMMLHGLLAGAHNPQLKLQDTQGNIYLTISSGSIILHPENFEEITGHGKNNKNCFGFVLSPFYPKEFGRYDEKIKIVMSRIKDFGSIPREAADKIRHNANVVYQMYGAKINDLYTDMQGEGLWLPEYVT